jgi:tRNA threonylcarbamoyladenosine biosynthesis protein TsaB
MILCIDTSDMKKVVVSLRKEGKILDTISEDREYGSQVLLPIIDKILKKNKLEYADLKGIEVETGPGSFTGLRVGVAVANALSYSLGIPVNQKPLEVDLLY